MILKSQESGKCLDLHRYEKSEAAVYLQNYLFVEFLLPLIILNLLYVHHRNEN